MLLLYKALKSIKKRILISLLLLFLLLASVVLLSIKSSGFQTFLAQRVVAYLNSTYKTDIHLDGIEINGLDEVKLHGLYVLDHRKDTLARISTMEINLNVFRRIDTYIDLDHVYASSVLLKIHCYEGEETNNFTQFIDLFASEEPSSSAEFGLRCREVNFSNVEFYNWDENISSTVPQIDFDHLALRKGDIHLSEFKMLPETILGTVDRINFEESKGFSVQDLNGVFRMRPGNMSLTTARLKTSRTDLDFDYNMAYSDFGAFSEFLDSVILSVDVRAGNLSSNDLYLFSETFEGLNLNPDIRAKGEGPVNDLEVEYAELVLDNQLTFKASGSLKQITEPKKSLLDLQIEDVSFYPAYWDSLPTYPFKLPQIEMPTYLGQFKILEAEGKLKGSWDKLKLNLLLEGDRNFAELKAEVKELLSGKPMMQGELKGSFDLAQLSGASDFGNARLQTSFKLSSSQTFSAKGTAQVLEFQGYPYTNLQFQGDYKNDSLQAFALLEDPNGRLEVATYAVFTEGASQYSGSLRLDSLFPGKLKLSKMDTNINFTFGSRYSIKLNKANELYAGIFMDELLLKNEELEYKEADAGIEVWLEKNRSELETHSRSFDLSLKSNRGIETSNEILAQAFDRFLPSQEVKRKTLKQGHLDAALNIHDANRLLHVFDKDLSIKDELNVNAEYRTIDSMLYVKLHSAEVSYGQMALEEPIVELIGDPKKLSLNFTSQNFVLSDSFQLPDLLLRSHLERDTFNLSLNLNRVQEDHPDNGFVILDGHIDEGVVYGRMVDGHIQIRDSLWKLFDRGGYTLDESGLHIIGLGAQNDGREVRINGDVGKLETDVLMLSIQDLNIQNMLSIISNEKLQGSGSLSGEVKAAAVLSDPQLEAELRFSDLVVNDQEIGEGKLKGKWLGQVGGLDLKGSFINNGNPILWLEGFYYPVQEEENLVLNGLIRNFKLASLSPLLKEYISDLQGELNGELSIRGTPLNPRLFSNLKFNKAAATVNYLGTRYYIDNQTFKIREDWFGFDHILIKDENDGTAYANATIFHENYQKFNFDINFETDNFRVLNTTEEENSLYYGRASAAGVFGVSGYADQLVIDTDLKVLDPSEFFVPLEGAEEVTANEFIFFKSADSNSLEPQVDLSGIQMNMQIEVDDGTQVQLIFDETAGDIMEARGEGSLRMEINTNRDFNMFGLYTVNSGSYLFTLNNLISKKFTVRKGSTIQWNGDPLHANLDLTAIYKVRARLSDLLNDPTLSKRTNTQVLLHMSEDLLEPQISFDLAFPDVDASIQTRAQSALSTTEAKNNQVFSLLLLNSFVPTGGDQLGAVTGSSTTDLLESQLSNWLSTLSDKIAIGVNELDAASFELALSRGFFDDRVTFETNLGVSNEQGADDAESSGRFIGDFKLEYKIRPDGRLKAKVFNRSNDDALINAQNARDTQGVGLFFRQDFENWGEFWSKSFKRKNKEKSSN